VPTLCAADGRLYWPKVEDPPPLSQKNLLAAPGLDEVGSRLTANEGRPNGYPVFSPDGWTIAFVSNRTGIGHIWV
jgi:Tol biopolymer transport system component